MKDKNDKPTPRSTPAPLPPPVSGEWVQTVPKSLHRQLIAMAKLEDVSVQEYVTYVLSLAMAKAAP